MLGIKERAFAAFWNVCLETLVPANHFYRHLDAKLDLNVRPGVGPRHLQRGGRRSIDPVVFFKLQGDRQAVPGDRPSTLSSMN